MLFAGLCGEAGSREIAGFMENMKYPIRAVCKLTGLTTDTVRAWERRYGAVKPLHERGGRIYSHADVRRLELLKDAVAAGHRIGKIAGLSDAQLQKLSRAAARSGAVDEAEESKKVTRLLALAREYDFVDADNELDRLAAFMRPLDFIHRIAVPLVDQAEEESEKGRLSLAQKHMLFVLLRNVLGSLTRLQSYRDSADKAMLFTTLPLGVYEIGALLASALAAVRGVRALYLGPNLPAADILQAARKASVSAVALWLNAEAGQSPRTAESIAALHRGLSKGVGLLVGGPISTTVRHAIEAQGVTVCADFEAFENLLV